MINFPTVKLSSSMNEQDTKTKLGKHVNSTGAHLFSLLNSHQVTGKVAISNAKKLERVGSFLGKSCASVMTMTNLWILVIVKPPT
jgi:hypothetical protein